MRKTKKLEDKIFEPSKKTDFTDNLGYLYPHRPVVLRNPSINLTNSISSIIKAFQNPIWAEQARERLKQIRLLTKVVIA